MAKNLQPFRKNKTDGTPQIYKAYFVNAVREILSSGERLFKKTRAISDVCRYLNLGQNKKDKVYFTFTDLKRLEEFALNNYGCEFISEAIAMCQVTCDKFFSFFLKGGPGENSFFLCA